MKPTQSAIELIKHFEGFCPEAYLCPAKIPTIGYGSTRYESGAKVKPGDSITRERAEELLRNDLIYISLGIDKLLKVELTQCQFDALCSFTYNVGIGNLTRSRLIARINHDPNDVWIEREFEKWSRVNNFLITGLLRRRRSEYWLYKHGEVKFIFDDKK